MSTHGGARSFVHTTLFMKFTWGCSPLITNGSCKHVFFVWHARYTRAVWRKAHKAKKENTEGKWPLWVEGVVKELFETMQPSTEDLAKSWGLPDPHLKLKLKLKRYSIYFHANLVTQFLKKKKIETIFNPAFFQEPKTHPS